MGSGYYLVPVGSFLGLSGWFQNWGCSLKNPLIILKLITFQIYSFCETFKLQVTDFIKERNHHSPGLYIMVENGMVNELM